MAYASDRYLFVGAQLIDRYGMHMFLKAVFIQMQRTSSSCATVHDILVFYIWFQVAGELATSHQTVKYHVTDE